MMYSQMNVILQHSYYSIRFWNALVVLKILWFLLMKSYQCVKMVSTFLFVLTIVWELKWLLILRCQNGSRCLYYSFLLRFVLLILFSPSCSINLFLIGFVVDIIIDMEELDVTLPLMDLQEILFSFQ